ncbi:hypothetical protein SLEP1_g19768 [Rubroshorea leprosula]|uniref:M-phase phosphoprotein 6 n=1 Tax=Rubroshorea leprosula TaxID=152421 RepID=A0AAV5J6F8_9ROSI|nr:hypothetical protein SLEP1_g19768 [Rubroshorea leprosula]
MAKRELSSTLRSLKFMQRAAQKEEKTKKEEEVKPDLSSTVKKKCVVIMEGDPHPGATIGRMSFRSFNPTIDKLNEKAANIGRPDSSGGRTLSREDGSSDGAECLKVDTENCETNEGLKRKQSGEASEPWYPSKSPKNGQGVQSSPSSSSSKASSHKQPKREKLDWDVLRPPKPQKGEKLN